MGELKYLNRFFLKYKGRFILGAIFVICANLFAVLPPQVIRMAIDLVKDNLQLIQLQKDFEIGQLSLKGFTFTLLLFGIIVLLLAFLRSMFTFFTRQTIIVMSRLIEFDLKNEIYDHYQKLDTAFYKRNNTGDLMSRITEDVSSVRMYLGPAVMYTINTIVLFIVVIVTMIKVNPRLTAYVLIPLPVLSISIFYVSTIINKRSIAIKKQLSYITTVSQEVFSGIRVVKSYVQEKFFGKFFDREIEDYKVKTLKLARVEALFFPLMILLIGLSTLLTIYIGGIEVMKGKLTTGNIAEFVIYVSMLTWPVTSIGWVASLVQKASASQQRINEFLNTKPNIKSGEKDIDLNGRIEFKNVSFTYADTGVQALKQISFNLNKGQKMAIIGRTGSGKTTIADLLLRMYDPVIGTIEVDGNNIEELNLDKYRSQIGYVPQDVFLFSDTVENNIKFSNNKASHELVVSAANTANVAKDIAQLNNGYETMVGERGVTLSGGQKQRISIARAFVKNPKVIVLDDCLSAVDANTEKEILTSLNNELKDKTAIIITHRIFSLLAFDKIIVLDEGMLVEEGKHDELMAKNGLYYELYQKQQEEQNVAN